MTVCENRSTTQALRLPAVVSRLLGRRSLTCDRASYLGEQHRHRKWLLQEPDHGTGARRPLQIGIARHQQDRKARLHAGDLGSKVFATLDKRVTVDPTAIPWLRLLAASPTAGSDGDRLAGTTYIQRIATTGGLAPAPATCNENTVGTVEEVPYTADYTFWKSAS